MDITRTEFISKVETWLEKSPYPTGNSFAYRGARARYDSAAGLLRLLKDGGKPSTQQTVGWFGKGARFSE